MVTFDLACQIITLANRARLSHAKLPHLLYSSLSLQTEESTRICTKTSYTYDYISNLYNDLDETLGNPNHNTLVMEYFSSQTLSKRKQAKLG